jgi:FkbM family methyltransferase
MLTQNEVNFYSQLGQDKFVDDFFKQKTGGVFLDIGASDGVTGSNTLFLEKHRDWKGICVEPCPGEFKKLVENRTSININACISNYQGEGNFTYVEGYANMLSGLSESYNQSHKNRIDSEVKKHGGKVTDIKTNVFTLQSILDLHSIQEVDYCSLDTEGSELEILNSIDYTKTKIHIFSIENNYNEDKFEKFLKDKGYYLHSKLMWDDIFILEKHL